MNYNGCTSRLADETGCGTCNFRVSLALPALPANLVQPGDQPAWGLFCWRHQPTRQVERRDICLSWTANNRA